MHDKIGNSQINDFVPLLNDSQYISIGVKYSPSISIKHYG